MKPHFANYFLTFKCELACDFCPFWRQYDETLAEAPLEVTLKNLERLAENGVKFLNFSGGDPFLYNDFPRVLKKAKELKMITSVSSSGLRYPELADKTKGQIDFLCFDLNADNPERFSEICGFNFFEKICESIKLSKRLRQNSFIKFVVHRNNVLYLQEMVELAVSLKIPLMLRPEYQNNELSGFDRQTFPYIRRYFSNQNVFLNTALFEFLKASQNKKIKPQKICRAGQFIVTVLPDGAGLYPCVYRPVYRFNLGEPQNAGKFLGGFGRKEFQKEIFVCENCRDWDYLEPSFFYGLNRYLWFNIYSWGNYFLKKAFSPVF